MGERQGPGRGATVVILMLAVPLALGACASDNGDSGGAGGPKGAGEIATNVTHIHGLAVGGTGDLYIATHVGLIRAPAQGPWVYASNDRNDHMGFSLDPKTGTMWRSGHSPTRPSLGVQTSTDGGATWKDLASVLDPPVDFHAMTVSFANATTLWGYDGRGMFRSDDAGEGWKRLSDPPSAYVLVGPKAEGVVFAGTADGLMRSDDGGATWKPVAALSGGWVAGLAVDPSDAARLIASTSRGLKVSSDGGATWTPSLGGIPAGAEIATLAISPVDPRVAYAADATTIYRSSDGGKTWTEMPVPAGSSAS